MFIYVNALPDRDKLGNASLDDRTQDFDPPMSRPVDIERHDTLEVNQNVPVMTLPKETPSQKTGRTLLSGTEATQHHQSLDDIVDTKSVTSYATTVRDLSGKGIELPSPPKTADGERDFECPYCFIICPAYDTNPLFVMFNIDVMQEIRKRPCMEVCSPPPPEPSVIFD